MCLRSSIFSFDCVFCRHKPFYILFRPTYQFYVNDLFVIIRQTFCQYLSSVDNLQTLSQFSLCDEYLFCLFVCLSVCRCLRAPVAACGAKNTTSPPIVLVL